MKNNSFFVFRIFLFRFVFFPARFDMKNYTKVKRNLEGWPDSDFYCRFNRVHKLTRLEELSTRSMGHNESKKHNLKSD